MLSQYLLTFYRSIARHKLYAAINILGLAVGIAVFLVLSLVVRFETSFERWIPDAGQIYAIETYAPALHLPPSNASVGEMVEALHADYPQIIATRVREFGGAVRQGGAITSEQVTEVDPTFFRVFDLPLVAGDKAHMLHSPDDVVITETKARRYFGTSSPIGQSITLDYNDKARVYRVVGVIKDPPATTDFNFDFLVPVIIPSPSELPAWRSWGNVMLQTYMRLSTPRDAAALDADLDRFFDRHAGHQFGPNVPHTILYQRTLPLLENHLFAPPGVAVVDAIGAVGLLTLLLAAVNYINLATARAGLRAREVALRKVMGATAHGLIIQFLAEALAMTALGTLCGLALCELTLPVISTTLGMKLSLDYSTDPVLWVFVGLVLVITGLAAGLYPAFVLSRFRPAAVLASARSPGGGRWAERLRAGLVVFQFAAAILFTIGAGVILSQSSYLRKADLGFARDGLIIVKSFNHDGMTAPQHVSLLTAWRATPGVISAAESNTSPGDEPPMVENLKRVGVQGQGAPLQLTIEGPDFFQTYASVLVAGRLADRAHGEDFPVPSTDPKAPPTLFNVVLNETATKVLGFHDPSRAVGQQLNGAEGLPRYRVIGVLRDIRFGQPRVRIPPMVYIGQGGSINESVAAVRYSGSDPKAMIARLGAEWRQIVPTEPFEAVTAAQALEPYYHGDDQVSRLLAIAAVLAVAIGAVGLYGLASFNTGRRAKEIGIRKTLGASTWEMLRLLVGQFLRPVLWANLIAWPLAYLAMRAYLAGFDQRIALGPLYFLGATALTLLVAIGTVAGQTYAVARAEPAKALRHE